MIKSKHILAMADLLLEEEKKHPESMKVSEANVMPRNKASLRVLEKNRFVNEGLSKYYLKINGVWEDHIHMVKINYAVH